MYACPDACDVIYINLCACFLLVGTYRGSKFTYSYDALIVVINYVLRWMPKSCRLLSMETDDMVFVHLIDKIAYGRYKQLALRERRPDGAPHSCGRD
jgi:hypothetical protein